VVGWLYGLKNRIGSHWVGMKVHHLRHMRSSTGVPSSNTSCHEGPSTETESTPLPPILIQLLLHAHFEGLIGSWIGAQLKV
jgi:hypothetical protein